MTGRWFGSTSCYWLGWWNWHVGVRFGRWPIAIDIGFGHLWAPRYCITWLGLFSYWHGHWKDETMALGWAWNVENLGPWDPEEERERSR